MQELEFTYYKGDKYFVGWMEDYPDYWTQGETLDELKENLRDILTDINLDLIPFVRHRSVLVLE